MRRSPLLALSFLLGAGAVAVPTAHAVDPEHSAAGSGWVHSARAVAAPRAALSGTAAALPTDPGAYVRLAGADRYATAVQISREMVCSPTATTCDVLGGIDAPVDVVFVASAANFPDALGAGPLASGLGPLLLVPPTGTVPSVVIGELQRIKPEYVVVIGGPSAVSSAVESQLARYASKGTSRVSGADRYQTAVEAAYINDGIWRELDEDDDGVPDGRGLDVVVLTSGEGFADALGGGGAAANNRGALLLTAKGSLPSSTRTLLRDVKPARVVIAGGTAVVSAAVESAVRSALPSATVTRAAGADRYSTAVALSKALGGSARAVFVVNGKNFPDALASAPFAGVAGASTLLTSGPCVTAGTRSEASRLDPEVVAAIGGTSVVSDRALRLGSC